MTVYDRITGTVSLVDQQPHYEAIDGIVWSPWNTLLFAEERIVANLKDPRVPNAVGGLVYEWSPVTRTTRPLPAVGVRSHEGLRFDPRGNLYGISESTPNGTTQSGAIFKFVPDRRGDLSSGRLYALNVLDAASRTGEAVWVPLDRGWTIRTTSPSTTRARCISSRTTARATSGQSGITGGPSGSPAKSSGSRVSATAPASRRDSISTPLSRARPS